MPLSSYQLEAFSDYFSGSTTAFGEHVYGEVGPSGKREGKSRTIRDQRVTISHYRKHLEGVTGLGIVPLNESSRCKFAVIDVDIYDADLNIYLDAIERNLFPIVPFRSKSGGLHLYTFFREEVPAGTAVELMQRLASMLAIDTLTKQKVNRTVEIFPKQIKLPKNGVGSWINLPYYNGENAPLSPALRGGNPLSLEDALDLIKKKRTTPDDVIDFLNDIPFSDAPPCLQIANILQPVRETGGRNNYLFSVGVYLKKKDEDFFEQHLLEINDSLPEPLEEEELKKTVVSSLQKKDYLYRCKESPCVDYCNRRDCRSREFGIGKTDGYFSAVECGQMFQYRTAAPYYEWDVRLQGQDDYRRLRFRGEDEIIKQDTFLRLCMRELYELPNRLKPTEWFKRVNTALKEIQIINVEHDEDTSPLRLAHGMIVDFLTNRAPAATRDQILTGRVFFDVKTAAYFFRLKDLQEYVFSTRQLRYFSPGELHGILRDMGTEFGRRMTTESGKQIRIAIMYQNRLTDVPEEDIFVPDFSEEPAEDF